MAEEHRRRLTDSDEFDPRPHRVRNGRQDLLQVILKYGLSTFLVLWLLGAFKPLLLPSPIIDMKQAIEKHEANQDMRHAESLRLWRIICRGAWQYESTGGMQAQCDR